MWKKWGAIAIALALGLTVGCGQDTSDDDRPDVNKEETGLAMSVEFNTQTDVAGFEYSVRKCGEKKEVHSIARSLEELNSDTNHDTNHQLASYFAPLDEGCYDVDVIPRTQSGDRSADCAMASAYEVFVVNNRTTEIMLVSQCDGDEQGGADIISALNHPPQIESIDYNPSKFVHECEIAQICVTAYDPDGDPMEFVFEQTEGKQLRVPIEASDPVVDGNRATSCIEAVPVWYDDYEFAVTVYDQAHDDGELVRIEDLYGSESRAQMEFPLYSNWDVELECYAPETDTYHRAIGVRDIERHPECIPLWPWQYYCSDFHWDHTDKTCPDGEFAPETIYPICSEHEGLYDMETENEAVRWPGE